MGRAQAWIVYNGRNGDELFFDGMQATAARRGAPYPRVDKFATAEQAQEVFEAHKARRKGQSQGPTSPEAVPRRRHPPSPSAHQETNKLITQLKRAALAKVKDKARPPPVPTIPEARAEQQAQKGGRQSDAAAEAGPSSSWTEAASEVAQPLIPSTSSPGIVTTAIDQTPTSAAAQLTVSLFLNTGHRDCTQAAHHTVTRTAARGAVVDVHTGDWTPELDAQIDENGGVQFYLGGR